MNWIKSRKCPGTFPNSDYQSDSSSTEKEKNLSDCKLLIYIKKKLHYVYDNLAAKILTDSNLP